MARGVIGGEGGVAQSQGFSITDQTHILHGWKTIGFRTKIILRIFFSDFSALKHGHAPFAGQHLRPAEFLQCGNPTGMIIMRVAVEDVFDIQRVKTHLTDVRIDQWRRLGQSTIDQDQPCIGDHQQRGQTRRAHVPGIAINLERLLR